LLSLAVLLCCLLQGWGSTLQVVLRGHYGV
jgi:hypothetical protein